MNFRSHSLLTEFVRHLFRGGLVLVIFFHGFVTAQITEQVAKSAGKFTVRIIILSEDELKGHGTGFIIDKKGHVATNRHVIEEAEDIIVIYAQGEKVFFRPAKIACVSRTADLAILKVDPIPLTEPAKLAVGMLETGAPIMTVGFPGALDKGTWMTLEGVEHTQKSGEGKITTEEAKGDFVPAVFPGSVAKNMMDSDTKIVLHSAKISGGNSGGPLIDSEGRVCGINTALLPASLAGVDYPVSIHASELLALARANSIPVNASSKKAYSFGSLSRSQIFLYITLAVFAVVIFLMMLRKPRTVVVDAVSRVVRPKRNDISDAGYRHGPPVSNPYKSPANAAGNMRLRGRDLQGRSYDLVFGSRDFGRHANRLVVGRNNDLSQLVLSHDSVSRQHATLVFANGAVLMEDRNSGNGTKINGRDLHVGSAAIELRSGDKITLGEVELNFEKIS